ncbi:MAG TPA: carboxypeptidase-like regulatory domain-containing protein [Vicinamibacterales bacterium]|nr:carboxypeptidase-like regulatory domain-containing protein [Vicinamibacterales bacterium]
MTTASGLDAPVTLTDADGRFTLSASGTRGPVVATKTGCARGEAIAADRAIEIRLKRGAVVSGRVVDEFGDPVIASRVFAQTEPGARLSATMPSGDTDDRGEYRITDLPAGSFAIAVVRLSGMLDPFTLRPQLPETIFYPGTISADGAQKLAVEWGREQRRIDFVLPARRPMPPTSMIVRNAQGGGQPSRPGPPPAGAVRGRVLDRDGRGVPHAAVELTVPGDFWRGVLTDDRGSFEFREIPAGTFFVSAGKTGYTSDLRSVKLADGDIAEPTDVSIARYGVITGRIVDELGEPVERVNVDVLQIQYEAGRRRLASASAEQSQTDDFGRYRLFGLKPGQYVVTAIAHGVQSADLPGYARAFFPGTTSASDARFITVGGSEEAGGIDFALSRARTFRVAGRILNSSGQPTMGGSLRLLEGSRSAGIVGVEIGARLGSDGAFEFPSVTPGQYVIRADRGRQNNWKEGEFGAIPVIVADSDLTGLVVPMSAGSSIHGRIRFDSYSGGAAAPSPASIELAPVPADFDLAPSNTATADIHPDWTFDIAGINGPRRFELLRWPNGWMLEEIRANGIDVTDRPLPFGKAEQSLRDVEVVLTDRVSELAGAITDDRDQALATAAGSIAIAFSTDRSRWYEESRFVRKATAGSNGEFSIVGLPFGTYYVVVLGRTPLQGDGAWRDPAVLDALTPRAVTVVVRDGQRQTVRVRTERQ